MISFLDNLLPPELCEIIARKLHASYIQEICDIINHKMVFIIADQKLSWIACETQNYYSALEVEGGWNDVS
tara:strand:+ start:124 stop:336 length:213 start_codon:yes stop_codon:yes gene_type:complete